MSKEKLIEQLTSQFQQEGTLDLELLHNLCRTIDIKKQLPFDQCKIEDFMTVLLAAYEKAGCIKQAKYLNTMLYVRDCAASLPADIREQVKLAFDRVCAC